MPYLTERCGAWQVGEQADGGPIEFRIFFPAGVDPQVLDIRVAGNFQSALGRGDWDFENGLQLERDDTDPRGVFWSVSTEQPVPSGFYEYKYLVTFEGGEQRKVTDPCTRYGGLSDRNAAVVVGGSSAAENAVRPLVGGRRPLTDLTVYELMIDDFTADFRAGRAPLEAAESKLDHIEELGFNAILFMPWTTWKNSDFDWGYEPFQYFAVESRYADKPGAPAEKLSLLKQLISACHDRGIHVIMDGVFNHVSYEFPYNQLYREPQLCPFTAAPFGGSFPGLQDLDFNNTCTQEFIREVCAYWIDTFGIDGIRFDNTVNFYVAGDIRGLPELLADVAADAATRGEENFSLTLEHINLDAVTVTNSTAATSFWDNSLFQLAFDYLWNDRIDGRLLNALNNRRFLALGKVPTLYLSNHDHSQVAWQAGARADVGATGAWWKVQPFVIALYTSTAVPLVPNGQEMGEDHFLPEDDHGAGRRVISRPLRWKTATDAIGTTLGSLHRALGAMRSKHPGLRSAQMYPASWDESQSTFNPVGVGVDVARQLAIYHRWAELDDGSVENFVIVLNFADADQTAPVPFPVAGEWVDLLADFNGTGARFTVTAPAGILSVPVGSHWGRVFFRDNQAAGPG